MDRNCSKCVHHTSGGCSKWECTGTVTIKDVKEEALNDLLDSIKNGDDYPQFVACGLKMENCGYQIPYDMAEHERIIRADAIEEYVTRFEAENITDANAERLKPFIFEMHRLAEQMQKGAGE